MSAVDTQAKTAETSATVRRSNASASMPPYSPARIIGTSETTPTRETMNVDRVISYTSSPTVTLVIIVPMPAIELPSQSRAKAGERRSGVRSANRERRGFAGASGVTVEPFCGLEGSCGALPRSLVD